MSILSRTNISRKIFAVLFLKLFFATPAFSQYNIDALLKQAIRDVQKENYTDAIAKLNICVTVEPGNCEAWFYRAASKFSLFDNTGAEEDFTMALSNYSSIFYDAYRYRAEVRYRLSDYSGAIEDFNKVIEKEADNPKLYLQRAYAKLAGNDLKGAIGDCEKALNLKSIGEDVYLCKATAESEQGNYAEAITDYDKALKINSKNEDAHIKRGSTLYKAEDYCGAIEDYNAAIKIDTASTLAYFYRADAEVKTDSNKAALRDYNTVLLYEPRNSYAYFNRGALYSNIKKYKSAIGDFDKVLILDPDNIQALSNRAKLEQNTKDFKDAIKDYDRIIELYPYMMEAYYNRAEVKTAVHDIAGAKKDLETGKTMSEVFHSKNNIQLSHDSTLVENLLHLSADFNSTPKTRLDTLNVQFQPFFYIAEKGTAKNSRYLFDPLLTKINKQENKSYCFTNNEIQSDDTIANQPHTKNFSLAVVIQKTNNYLLTDAFEAINKIVEEDTANAMAYFQRGIITCREIEASNNNDGPSTGITSSDKNASQVKEKRLSAISDFTKALQLQPSFSFAYFNRANLKCALSDFYGALKDYETAIKTKSDFAEAYFNMGFVTYYLNEKSIACNEFSKAGELGIPAAYAFIKQYCTTVPK